MNGNLIYCRQSTPSYFQRPSTPTHFKANTLTLALLPPLIFLFIPSTLTHTPIESTLCATSTVISSHIILEMSDQTKKPKGTTGSTTKAKAIAQTQLVDGLARLIRPLVFLRTRDLTLLKIVRLGRVLRSHSQMRGSRMESASRGTMSPVEILQKSVQRRVSGTSRTTTALPHCLLTLLFW